MRSAVVVGAGVGGLAVAGALARSGWQVTVLERAERVRPEPTAVVLWPNGVRALQALGLGAGLAAIATPLPDGGVRRPDGHWLVQPRPIPADRSAGSSAMRALSRAGWRDPGGGRPTGACDT